MRLRLWWAASVAAAASAQPMPRGSALQLGQGARIVQSELDALGEHTGAQAVLAHVRAHEGGVQEGLAGRLGPGSADGARARTIRREEEQSGGTSLLGEGEEFQSVADVGEGSSGPSKSAQERAFVSCSNDIGDSTALANENITASSVDPKVEESGELGDAARLHSGGGWMPGVMQSQWLQFSFNESMRIVAIRTQGAIFKDAKALDRESHCWTMKYYLTYSHAETCGNWTVYNNGIELLGNVDQLTVKQHPLIPFVARRVRIHPTDWPDTGRPGLRATFLGCEAVTTTATTSAAPDVQDFRNRKIAAQTETTTPEAVGVTVKHVKRKQNVSLTALLIVVIINILLLCVVYCMFQTKLGHAIEEQKILVRDTVRRVG